MIEIDTETQLDIFENIFLTLLDRPSFRWQILKMIKSRDRVDEAELDLKLRKLELEIIQKGGNENSLSS